MEGQTQNDPSFSLGGFCSSSQVPSSSNGAFFSSISEYTIDKNKPQYICLCLKNTFSHSVKNILFYFDYDDEQFYQCKYRVGFSLPAGRQFEWVNSIYAKPVYVEFDTADGMNDAISLPDMNPNDIIGIWIERQINQECPEIAGRKDPDWLLENFGRERRKDEHFDIKISFENESAQHT